MCFSVEVFTIAIYVLLTGNWQIRVPFYYKMIGLLFSPRLANMEKRNK